MLFNSYQFLIFLPIVFILYWFVFSTRRLQNLLIVVASYIFYGWWDWRFLLLIAATSIFSFVSGLLIAKYEKKRKTQQSISATNIVVNLLILGIFKYYNFFANNLVELMSLMGLHLDGVTINIILPVGISFYTFQALSYTIDVYQKRLPATKDIVEFMAYISFFPQLVAGPIERATNLLPQFQQRRVFCYERAADGCRQMLCGFFKKIVIADQCAEIVNSNWEQYQEFSGLSLLVLGILFTFQIYCDFSGYSDIAIGCARIFGFNLMRNFNYPYFSFSIPEFWRRWHISLTTWFRDYIYFPLGGSRCEKRKIIRNIFVVWSISGLWHGANWTFICWGLYHGTLLAIYNILGINTKPNEQVRPNEKIVTHKLKLVIQWFITFFLVVVGWILFRAETISQAYKYIVRMLTHMFDDYHIQHGESMLYCCFAFLFVEWLQKKRQHVLQFPNYKPFKWKFVRWIIYYTIIFVIAFHFGKEQSFIYFQF